MQRAIKAYFHGLLGDATYSRLHNTWRIAQKERAWLEKLQTFLKQLGCKAWIYLEGKNRRVYILETTAKFLSDGFNPANLENQEEKIAYIRGYFDAEGRVPQNSKARFYIQFVQKNKKELQLVQKLLQDLQIESGVIHNPSQKVDPDYWRFFVQAKSYQRFIQRVGSWHPRKAKILQGRMKI
jgi:intein-encoded DNA endonuclease-like protein